MRSDLNAIPVFVAVVECGNFAQAAEKLNVTRSAVGKTISRLEQRLGVALFQRTTRRQALTEEGEVFYLQSRRALDSLRDAENEIQRGKTRYKGGCESACRCCLVSAAWHRSCFLLVNVIRSLSSSCRLATARSICLKKGSIWRFVSAR